MPYAQFPIPNSRLKIDLFLQICKNKPNICEAILQLFQKYLEIV